MLDNSLVTEEGSRDLEVHLKSFLMENIVNDTVKKNDLAQKTVYSILFSISFAHLLNDLIQAIIPSIYPIL